MPRLFTGLQIPSDVATGLALLQGGLPGARWIERENLHLTLRFIGEISGPAADDLFRQLDLLSFPPIELQLKGLGHFGGNRPHSLHVKALLNPQLSALQQAHERLCQSIGLEPETRNYTPHVTIARLRGTSPGAVSQYFTDNNLHHSRLFTVAQFAVFSARPSHGGGPYAVEQLYDLDLPI